MAKKSTEPKTRNEPEAAAQPARASNGQFTKGNSGGPGRPPAVAEASYLRELRRSVPPPRFAKIIEAVYGMATDPEARPSDRLRAAQVLIQQCCPAPQQRLSIEQGMLDVEAQSEFRVAGASVSQIDEEFLAHLGHLIEEQAAYEQSLREAGYLPQIPAPSDADA